MGARMHDQSTLRESRRAALQALHHELAKAERNVHDLLQSAGKADPSSSGPGPAAPSMS